MKSKSGLTEALITRYVELCKRYGSTMALAMMRLEKKDVIPLPKVKKRSKCRTCSGYGLWGIGEPSPMGRIDASEGEPTKECPECLENPNPIQKEAK